MKIAHWICGFAAFAVLHTTASAQVNTTITVDLKFGVVAQSDYLLVEIPGIAGVVFRHLPHPTSCPYTQSGDFELKKLNPGTGRATTLYSSCGTVDSIAINTKQVWEIQTSTPSVYYLQLVELEGTKVKLRITSEMPALGVSRSEKTLVEDSEGTGFLVDGKKPSSADFQSDIQRAKNVWVRPKAFHKQ